MAPVIDEGVPSLSFRLEGDDQIVLYEYIWELLWFRKEAPKQVDVQENVLGGFWGLIAGEDNRWKSSIRNPIINVFHTWMCKRIFERIKEIKSTTWSWIGFVRGWLLDKTLTPHISWLIGGVVEQPQEAVILVRGATSLCGLFHWGLELQGTQNFSSLGLLWQFTIWNKGNILMGMRREDIIGQC
jgi:hypothetical protein